MFTVAGKRMLQKAGVCSSAAKTVKVTMRAMHVSSPFNSFHGTSCSCCNPFSTPIPMKSNRAMIPRQKMSTFDSLTSDEIDDEKSPYMRELLENNRKWIKETHAKDPDFFNKLAQPQRPRFLYIGCADSRVPANEILGLG